MNSDNDPKKAAEPAEETAKKRAVKPRRSLMQRLRRLLRSWWSGLLGIIRFAWALISLAWRGLDLLWQRIPRRYRSLTVNLGIGLVIWAAFLALQDNPRLRRMEDGGFDWIMQMAAGITSGAPEERAGFAFLDIDERSHRRWDEPLFTPRDKLAALVRHAVVNGAALVILDVEVSREQGPEDGELAAYLASLGPEDPHVLLARGLRRVLTGPAQGEREPRPSFLDPVVASSPNLDWAATLFDLDDDGKVRRWRLWEHVALEAKSPEPQPGVVVSMQLLSGALLLDPGAAATLTQKLRRRSLHGDETIPPPMAIGPHLLDFSPGRQERRIIYSIPWRLKEGQSYPQVILNGEPAPLVYIKPAYTVTDIPEPPPDPSLAGRIVVIGASFDDSRDAYATPLGHMPGSMVIINAVDTFLRFGAVKRPPLWLRLLIMAFLVTVMSVCFWIWKSFLGMLVSGLVIILSLLPLSFWFYADGYWLDFAVPLVAVQVYKVADEFRKLSVLARRGRL